MQILGPRIECYGRSLDMPALGRVVDPRSHKASDKAEDRFSLNAADLAKGNV